MRFTLLLLAFCITQQCFASEGSEWGRHLLGTLRRIESVQQDITIIYKSLDGQIMSLSGKDAGEDAKVDVETITHRLKQLAAINSSEQKVALQLATLVMGCALEGKEQKDFTALYTQVSNRSIELNTMFVGALNSLEPPES